MIENSHANRPTHCYVDESIHRELGYVAVAFVFAAEDLNTAVAAALTSAGMDPKQEEFKSGARMAGNPKMQAAREALLEVIREKAPVAVVFASLRHFVPLGKQCLQALQSVLVRNGVRPEELSVYFDQGIFASSAEAERLVNLFRFLRSATFRFVEASHLCLGIQLADLMAHTFAQIVREAVTGKPKLIDVGGPDYGYANGTQMPLSEFLLASIRHKILARRMVYEGEDFDPATDPVIIGPDDDPAEYGQNPEAFGWGVQVAPEAREELRRAVRDMLDRVWLGCMH